MRSGRLPRDSSLGGVGPRKVADTGARITASRDLLEPANRNTDTHPLFITAGHDAVPWKVQVMGDAGDSGLVGIVADASHSATASEVARRALQAVRRHLKMDAAYVSEIVNGRTVFREVDAPGQEKLIKVGDSYSLDDVYCQRVIDGRLPELIPNTADVPEAMALPITQAVPIGSHISVPLRLPDGRVYGSFCCLSFKPDPSLNDRDLQMMRAFADVTAFQIYQELETAKSGDASRARIEAAIAASQLSIVYQPVVRLSDESVAGFECLSRFSAEPVRTPDVWFKEAAELGMGARLETAAVRMALQALPQLPEDMYLAVNVSPDTAVKPELLAVLESKPVHRIVLEVTEHETVANYDALLRALAPLRRRGMRLAVDDAGAGYSSLRHILDLQPDLIKLDISLVRNIDTDSSRRALAVALIEFGRQTNCRIVAEGVETATELAALRELGVDKAQGYLTGRPMPLTEALDCVSAQKTGQAPLISTESHRSR